jgi:hypothetical protein
MASSGFIVEAGGVFSSEEGEFVSVISDLDSAYAVFFFDLLEGNAFASEKGDQSLATRYEATPHPLDHPIVEFFVSAPFGRLRVGGRVRR